MDTELTDRSSLSATSEPNTSMKAENQELIDLFEPVLSIENILNGDGSEDSGASYSPNQKNRESEERLQEIRELRESKDNESHSSEDLGRSEESLPGSQPEDDSISGKSPEIHKDDLYSVLSVSRRRDVVRYLEEKTGENSLADLGEMATHIAGIHEGKNPVEVTSSERKRVYVSLYQHHLEKLDEQDVISYDKNRGTVETGEAFDIVKEFVDDGFEDPEEYLTLEEFEEKTGGIWSVKEALTDAYDSILSSDYQLSERFP